MGMLVRVGGMPLLSVYLAAKKAIGFFKVAQSTRAFMKLDVTAYMKYYNLDRLILLMGICYRRIEHSQ